MCPLDDTASSTLKGLQDVPMLGLKRVHQRCWLYCMFHISPFCLKETSAMSLLALQI